MIFKPFPESGIDANDPVAIWQDSLDPNLHFSCVLQHCLISLLVQQLNIEGSLDQKDMYTKPTEWNRC